MDHVRAIFDSHPRPASDAGAQALALTVATSECAAACTACADACLEDRDPASLRRCIRMCLDCADICETTGRLVARPGKQNPGVLLAQLEACAAACRACAEHCLEHGERLGHCRECAASCRTCADACDDMRSVVVS